MNAVPLNFGLMYKPGLQSPGRDWKITFEMKITFVYTMVCDSDGFPAATARETAAASRAAALVFWWIK
jgi:hypothetical protein